MEDKSEIQIEYTFNTSPKVLYYRLSSPSGLSEWFCDDANLRDGIYTFYWDNAEQDAKLISKKENVFIRFQWLEDEGTDFYFEFRIVKDELTGDVALHVIDFAEDDEKEDTIELWNTQFSSLKHSLGL